MTALVTALFIDGFDARTLGEAVLLGVAAIVIGYVVARVWPRTFGAQLFGILAAAGFLGVLSYFGSVGAMIAIVVLVALAAVMAFTGML